jgi:putative oxidoreductase
MQLISAQAILVARVLVATVFVMNAIGVIVQAIPAREVMERGVPVAIVPWFMLAGRTLEFVAGFALMLGIFPRAAALALLAFLIPQRWLRIPFGCQSALLHLWVN